MGHAAEAFGRYLRDLRERRGLSLHRVSELAGLSPESIDAAALSRLERGLQSPSIYKLAPLSRIYGVPSEALIQRMELDREVDRLKIPDNEGKSYEELHRLGAAAMGNRKQEAYACFRDALPLAPEEKRFAAWSNVVTAIRSLGKNELALHECEALESLSRLTTSQRALLHDRMSNCHRCLGDMKRAEEYAEAAAAEATAAGDSRALAFAYHSRGNAALDQEQWEVAAGYLKRALDTYGKSAETQSVVLANPSFEVQCLLMLADCSIHLDRISHARRLALVAKRMSRKHDLSLCLAYGELLLGRIDARDGKGTMAVERFERAARIAESIHNRKLAFTVELELFRRAVAAGEAARARASRKRLERLAPWVPPHTPSLRDFKELIGRERPRKRSSSGRPRSRPIAGGAAFRRPETG